MRKEFELTDAEYKELIAACRPTPYIVVGGYAPRSPQEQANEAWCNLGRKRGFDGMSVRPVFGKDGRFFTADVIAIAQQAVAREARGEEA